MRLWSKGLGRSNLGIDFSKVQVLTLAEALERMPQQAAELFAKEVSTDKVVAVSGKILPPTGWDFVILFERKDILAMIFKLLFDAKTIRLISGDGEAKRRLKAREDRVAEKSVAEA